jgi:outer membrane protein with beta-barrel domain
MQNRRIQGGNVMQTLSRCLLVMGTSLALGASVASAQMPVQFGLGGGVTVPSGSTSNGLKTGWHGMALVQFKPATSPVGFQIDGAYQQLGFDGGGGKEQVIDGTGNIVYAFQVSPETKFRPYLIGGVGAYNIKDKFDVGGSQSDTKFGLNAGAGFNIQASGVGLFLEGRFHNVFVQGSDRHYIPITAGVRFGGT